MEGPLPEGFASLKGKKATLFSRKELERYMEEELRHDQKIITSHTTQSLQTMSSGERKKALLAYILKKKPDYLVLDNPFDNLDAPSREELKDVLHKMAATVHLILLISRSADLLPFVNAFAYLNGESLEFYPDKEAYLSGTGREAPAFDSPIPPPPVVLPYDAISLILLKNVSVSYYGKPILKDINWEVKRGEFWQLAGRNGSGKTTLLSMITGDNPKGYGQELYLFGHKKGSGESVWDIKRNLGYFTPAMMDRFRGYHSLENMLISGLTDSIGLYLRPTEAQLRIAREWLLLLGLWHLRDQYFHDLSAGMQRLVLCARAMVKHPLLLILDEPTAGLDDQSATLFVALVNKFARESNTAIIYVSHRDEPGLEPDAVLQLEMTPAGSLGNPHFPN